MDWKQLLFFLISVFVVVFILSWKLEVWRVFLRQKLPESMCTFPVTGWTMIAWASPLLPEGGSAW